MTKINTAPYALTTTTPRFVPEVVTCTYSGVFDDSVPELLNIRTAAEERNFELLEEVAIRYWNASIGVGTVDNKFDEVSAALCLLKPVVSFLNDELIGFDFTQRIAVINPLRMSFDISHLLTEAMDLTQRTFNPKNVPSGSSEWTAFAKIARDVVSNHIDGLKADEYWSKDINLLLKVVDGEISIDDALEYANRNSVPDEGSKCISPADLVVRLTIDVMNEVHRVSKRGFVTQPEQIQAFVANLLKECRNWTSWYAAVPILYNLILNTSDCSLHLLIHGRLLMDYNANLLFRLKLSKQFLQNLYRNTGGAQE